MRKHLHFSVDEWEGLPWWQQRAYQEQMVAEAEHAHQQQQVRVPRGRRAVPQAATGQVGEGGGSQFNVIHTKFG